MDMIKRPRRLRGGETIRKMVRETRMDKSSLIYPMFVQEGTGREDEIPSMPGQFRYTLDRLPYELERLAKAGVGSVMLFGIPDHKDEIASQAYAQDGIVQRALQVGKKNSRSCIILPMCVCVNIPVMGTVACFAGMKWKTTALWICWPRQPFPMYRQVRTWWHLPI